MKSAYISKMRLITRVNAKESNQYDYLIFLLQTVQNLQMIRFWNSFEIIGANVT